MLDPHPTVGPRSEARPAIIRHVEDPRSGPGRVIAARVLPISQWRRRSAAKVRASRSGFNGEDEPGPAVGG